MTTTTSEYTLYPKAKPTGELPPKVLDRLDERYLNVGEIRPQSGSAGVSIVDHGATPGVTADQTAAVQSALDAAAAAGLPTLVPPGTWAMNGALVLAPGADLRMAAGAVLDFSRSTATNYLNMNGSSGARVQAPTILKGASSVPLSGHSLKAGDWVLLRSADVFDSSSTSTTQGELIQVASVTSGLVTFRTTVCDTYQTSVTVTPVTMVRDVTITGGAIRGSGIPGEDKGGLRAQFVEGLRLDRVRFERIDRAHVFPKDCVNAWVTHCTFEWAESTTMGYGCSFGDSTRDSGCLYSTFRGVRHSLSTNNTTSSQNGGVPRRILFFGNTVEDTTVATSGSQMGGDAIDTHTAAEDIWIIQNSVNKSTGKGINMECASGVISGNTIDGTAATGIDFHNESDRPGKVTIIGNVVRQAVGNGISARTGGRGGQAPAESMIVTGNRVEDVTGNGVQVGYVLTDRGAVVTGNTVARAQGVPLRLLRLNGVVAHSNNLSGGGSIGIEYDSIKNGVLGPDSIDAGAPTGAWAGIKATNVSRSKLTPGAVQSPDPASVGVDIGSSCSYLALGPTAHLGVETPLVNNGPSTVRSY